jgi:tetratricopeptide (TPR) repeat protein
VIIVIYLMRHLVTALLFVVALVPASPARAAGGEPVADPTIDAAPCLAAAAVPDAADRIIATCGALIDNDKTPKPDRIKALIARAGALTRSEMVDRAIADYDAVLQLDPTLADCFNARGELWRRKGDRRRALADFAAALKLNPDQAVARANYKSLAQELEKLGALLAVAGKPSFSCANARRAVEKAICANPDLANLDREINAIYSRVLREAAGKPADIKALRREQEAFLASRNAAFGRRDYDLQQAMKQRLRQLTGVDGY